MPGHHLLLDLTAGIALLLWSARLVSTGVVRAFGERLREAVAAATSNRVLAFLAGGGIAAAMQSSTGSSLLTASFLERGLLTLATALAVLLGANVGTTIVVQALSLDIQALMPTLIVVGVGIFMLSRSPQLRNCGRALIGLGLMILSLSFLVRIADPLRANEALIVVFQQLSDEPVLALLVGAGLAWLVHSSIAIVLIVMTFADTGLVDIHLALALVLGANIGSGLAPLGLSLRSSHPVRRLLVGNLVTRALGALVMLPLIAWVTTPLGMLGGDASRQVANFHTLFNLALALVCLPLVDTSARLLLKLMPEPESPVSEKRPVLLDDTDLARPSVALATASREVIRLADIVEVMLRESILAFEESSDSRRKQIRQLDFKVDELQEGIKLYLTRLTRLALDEKTSRQAFDLILFTTDLEHVGDIIDKTLLELAAKRQRLNVRFSDEGWAEIRELHREVVAQMRLAVTVFLTRDVELARRLVEAKDHMRAFERSTTESHLRRLREGSLASIETSSLHMDVVRDLKQIAAHFTSVAYPILEAGGELRTSRLRLETSEPPPLDEPGLRAAGGGGIHPST